MLMIREMLAQGHSVLEARILFRIYEVEGKRLTAADLSEHGEFLYSADTIEFKWRGQSILKIVNIKE